MAKASTPGVSEMHTALRKRKVRKGTQSCWECRRRKIRCTFNNSTDSICDGCKSRRAECISQEFDVRPSAPSSKALKLDKVEALVEELARRTGQNLPHLLKNDSCAKNGALANVSTPNVSTTTALGPCSSQKREIHNLVELSKRLLAVWPSSRDYDLILKVDIGTKFLLHGIICKPQRAYPSLATPNAREMLTLPPPGSHPVLIARKLLLLGSFLQCIPLEVAKELEAAGVFCDDIMKHVVETASRLVTSDDSLIDSLEAIECIMVESMYYNNAGHLRRAWTTHRRALTAAQMMGLHLNDHAAPRQLDPRKPDRIEPEYMWARIVTTDRYLSLILGLPQGCQESSFAMPESLEQCAPADRLERMDSAIGSLIIQRRKEDLQNLDIINRIDKLLQDSAASMPAQWWLPPDIASISEFDPDAFDTTIRLMNQFTHYHLLAQLHLPLLLHSSTDRIYDYSKLSTVTACRELLSRFVQFRDSQWLATYCRGVDLLAFIAATVLCLAHIFVRMQFAQDPSHATTVLSFLAHHRVSDRGLMERTLQSMEKVAREGKDDISSEIVNILKPLLATEKSNADGDSDHAHVHVVSDLGGHGVGYGGDVDHVNKSISITVPFVATFKLQVSNPWSNAGLLNGPNEEPFGLGPILQLSPRRMHLNSHDMTNLYPTAAQPLSSPGYSVQERGLQAGTLQSHATRNGLIDFNYDEFNSDCFRTSDSAALGDSSALQGVDTALFDNLFYRANV